MVTSTPETAAEEVREKTPRRRRFALARLGADLGYVLPGFFVSLLAFILLVTLFTVSVGTLVVWVGALLLPLTLFVASGFAELDRTRLKAWGVALPAAHYRPRGEGIKGLWRWCADPRRWLDLLFETLVAFPLRVFTFCVAMTWIGCALGGLTWWGWAFYIPRSTTEVRWIPAVVEALTGGTFAPEVVGSFAFESACYFVIGAVFLATLPLVMRGLAQLDAAVTRAALGGSAGSAEFEGDGNGPTGGSWILGTAADGAVVRAGTGHPVRAERAWASARAAGSVPSAEGWAWIVAGFVAVAAVAVGWPVLAVSHGIHVVLAMVVTVAQAAGLVLSVRFPLWGIALATAAPVAAALMSTHFTSWPWPVTMMIVQAVLVLMVSLRRPWYWTAAALVLPHLGMLIIMLQMGAYEGRVNLLVGAAVSAGVAVIGVLLRLWLFDRDALLRERGTSAELDARQRELAERNRVAQELHDVVAHSMSVISVQATTARYRLGEGVSEEAAEEFESIAASSRQALTEMRGLLATLRESDAEAPLVPQPSLADIPSLVEATRRSGAAIELADGLDGAVVPPAKGLTAYRIVQEALSNAVRHAEGAAIAVTLGAHDGELVIEVENGPGEGQDAAPGAGMGILGITGRAEALGGSVVAGPSPDGGFRVRATLPLN